MFIYFRVFVAPLVGAWIEIGKTVGVCSYFKVAPLVGAWIEIEKMSSIGSNVLTSLLSWERGLKLKRRRRTTGLFVAPLVGAWIEILTLITLYTL